ncbi:HlyD family secretion protein [Sulfurimonas sp. SWIR-19]|uniref:HlyD family efflux transporter periplasmic adaptor subunit n=1 Tax=Sulfurimonas sp. SWIR-19 TaxID=2878390 RepID=UPI001CF41AF0|nr:HlyD family efflux transporter periplasmic adaptor subunit [Sulfurimonas sp. SWIR-19]UCN01238.1 HlyD family secretion protein [Sulfurimonas sp. SWIR-19]
MKIIVTFLFITTLLFSNVYYSKVEPYEIRTIASNVSGKVLYTDENMIGKKLSSKVFIKIDSELDEDELKAVEKKLSYQKNTLLLNEKILQNLQQLVEKKRENYQKIKHLKIKSRIEKDKEFYDLLSSENSSLATQKEINSLKTTIADLELRRKQLVKTIKDKNISAKGFVLYEISVKAGQTVGISTPLAKIADTSRALLSVYLDKNDLKDVKKKVIYINGKKTPYKVSRVSYIADTKNISKYKAQIIIDAQKVFSGLVKIEIKASNNEK